MRVLVCGGRKFSDVETLYRTLDTLHHSLLGPVTCILEGGAAGADRLASHWSQERGLTQHERYLADWTEHGKAAGPIRNREMLEKGKPDVVVAFPGGSGTADMVRRAKAKGVLVIEVPSAET